jgi:hypothetical protein
MPVRYPLRAFQWGGAFIAQLPTEKNFSLCLKSSLRHWQEFPNLFFAPLPTENKRPLTELCALLTVRILIANSCTKWRCSFKGLSQDGERADFSKNLHASLFNEYLSIEPDFSRIHIAGQYL